MYELMIILLLLVVAWFFISFTLGAVWVAAVFIFAWRNERKTAELEGRRVGKIKLSSVIELPRKKRQVRRTDGIG